jgi:DMSO reductase anchor subunit
MPSARLCRASPARMNPAFSVIFFTVMSGLGYGLWATLAARIVSGTPTSAPMALLALAGGGVLVAVGLCSSLLHLGQPLRAWRAFSQWRTSWLSREGVAAVASFVPAVALGAMVWRDGDAPGAAPLALRAMALLLLASAVATTVCTAMIYASLKPVPAWRQRSVPWGYLLLAAYTGSLAFAALLALGGGAVGEGLLLPAIVLAALLWTLKRRYWRAIDRPLEFPRAAALGLPRDRGVRVFERPHTEANYLTTEMGYVLARRHSTRLRRLALVLLVVVPVAALLPVWLFAVPTAPLLLLASLSALLGTFVERWLFFAEARHLVTLYY